MGCNCLETLIKTLRKQYDDAEFTNVGFAVTKANKIVDAPEPIRFRFHPKKADGTVSKKWNKSFITFNFCPLCGKPRKR